MLRTLPRDFWKDMKAGRAVRWEVGDPVNPSNGTENNQEKMHLFFILSSKKGK
jgi:hypothetical protein